MKRILSVLCASAMVILMSVITSCGSSSKKEGNGADSTKSNAANAPAKKYTNTDGKFSINFESEPKASDQKVPTQVGNIELHMFVDEKSATEACMVSYSDYPSELVIESRRDSILQGAKNGFISNLKAAITEEKKVKVGGNDAIFFKAASEHTFATFKMLLVGNRLYQVGIVRDGSFASDETVTKFLESFELIK